MIEQYMQVTIEFLKEVWFQLDSIFGLEEMEIFQLIKPYLLQLKENPTYISIALAAMILIPLGLYKIRSNALEQDRKLEELMEEMEDDEDSEDDPRRLRRPEHLKEKSAVISEHNQKPQLENGKEEEPSIMQILEKLDEEDKNDELHVDTQKIMGAEEITFKQEPISAELAESQANKELSEFEEFDFNNENNVEEYNMDIEDIEKESELVNLDKEFSEGDSLAKYSELDDKEKDRAIHELQDEMESTINKLTEQFGSTPKSPSLVEGLSHEEKSEEPESQYEGNSIPESESLSENIPKPEVVSMERLDTPEEPIIDKNESEPLQPVPERDYTFDSKPNREAETLIDRLKYFQANLDMRSNYGDKEESPSAPETTSKDLKEEPSFVEQQRFISKSPNVSLEDNKRYMEVLESFIFLKDQNKH